MRVNIIFLMQSVRCQRRSESCRQRASAAAAAAAAGTDDDVVQRKLQVDDL